MELNVLKQLEVDKYTQVVVFDINGVILDSDDTLVALKDSDFNVFSETMLCGMEDALMKMRVNEELSFDCINIDLRGRNSHYDFVIKKLEDGEASSFAWIIHDFGKQYDKIFELQQERNVAEIQYKKSSREANRLKEEKEAISELYQNLLENDNSQYVLIKSDNLLVNVDLNEILYFEAYGDYIKVHTSSKMYITYNTMRNIEQSLPEAQFLRTHRSYIVRLDKVKNIEQLSVEIGEKSLPIGKSYKSTLIQKIGQL